MDLSELRKNQWIQTRKGGLSPAAEPVLNAPSADRYDAFLSWIFFELRELPTCAIYTVGVVQGSKLKDSFTASSFASFGRAYKRSR